mmetsp:Transcript_31646/g.80309  ORF Transcript_31646/g.80309 Transcript_31646/m.80309 type:complete len:273 (-) Transcript_31646:200-1018(-)
MMGAIEWGVSGLPPACTHPCARAQPRRHRTSCPPLREAILGIDRPELGLADLELDLVAISEAHDIADLHLQGQHLPILAPHALGDGHDHTDGRVGLASALGEQEAALGLALFLVEAHEQLAWRHLQALERRLLSLVAQQELLVPHQDVLVVAKLYLLGTVLRIHDLLADLCPDGRADARLLVHAAGAHGHHLSLNGLLLALGGQQKASLGLFHCFLRSHQHVGRQRPKALDGQRRRRHRSERQGRGMCRVLERGSWPLRQAPHEALMEAQSH